mgnify:CR=1 FL=1
MKNPNYITTQESKKCTEVTNAFKELFETLDITVINTGKYGFALLKYYYSNGFQYIENYINSNNLFEALWNEWLKEKLIELCIDTPLINLDYKDMYDNLSLDTQKELIKTKRLFLSKVNNDTIKSDISTTIQSHINNKERDQCRILAAIFRTELEKHSIVIKETEKFGFIMLQYFEPKANFDCAMVFTDCQKMYDTLLNEWFVCQISDLMQKRYIINIDIDDFYNKLSKKEKEELHKKKERFINQIMKKASFIKDFM